MPISLETARASCSPSGRSSWLRPPWSRFQASSSSLSFSGTWFRVSCGGRSRVRRMAELSLRNVSKTYPGGVKAVDDLSLEITDGQFAVLLGPSGCGKSTALRMIAGLETADQGDVVIGGRRVNNVPPQKRDTAFVFQSYALYPHMTVAGNMGFGLKMRGMRPP